MGISLDVYYFFSGAYIGNCCISAEALRDEDGNLTPMQQVLNGYCRLFVVGEQCVIDPTYDFHPHFSVGKQVHNSAGKLFLSPPEKKQLDILLDASCHRLGSQFGKLVDSREVPLAEVLEERLTPAFRTLAAKRRDGRVLVNSIDLSNTST